VRALISFWLFLFGIFSGAGALYSFSMRYFDIGATSLVAEIIEYYRTALYPVWSFLFSLFSIDISPLFADVASVVSVFLLLILRLIVMLLGVQGLIFILLPLPEGPPFPRMGLRKAFGLSFSRVSIEGDDFEVRQFLGGPFWDYIFVVLGLTILLPVTFFGLWKNRWLYNVQGVVAGTPFLAEPGMVAFNFRSMFIRQCLAIFAAVLIFYVIN